MRLETSPLRLPISHCHWPRPRCQPLPWLRRRSRQARPKKTQNDGVNSKPSAVAKTAPRVWSFSFSIGRDQPFLIKGTIAEGTGARPEANGR